MHARKHTHTEYFQAFHPFQDRTLGVWSLASSMPELEWPEHFQASDTIHSVLLILKVQKKTLNISLFFSLEVLNAEKKQRLFFRETVTLPIKSYKTMDTARVLDSDRKPEKREFNFHQSVNLDHTYHKEKPYKSAEMLSVPEDPQFITHCEVDVTPGGSFKKRNSVSYLRLKQNETYEKNYDRRRSCPQGQFSTFANRTGSAPHILHTRIEEETEKNGRTVNQTGVPRLAMDRQLGVAYPDHSGHIPLRPRSNSAFIRPTSEIRQPVYFSTPSHSVPQCPHFASRHQSISYQPSSPTFFTSYPSRHRSLETLDFQRIRSPPSFQSSQIRHRSVGDCFRSNSPLWFYNMREMGEGVPVSPVSVFLSDRHSRGSQSSLGSRSDCSVDSTCDDNIEYIKLIKLINQPLDTKVGFNILLG